jgi:hypothetical protein
MLRFDIGFGIRSFPTGDINERNFENRAGGRRIGNRDASGRTGHFLRT